MFVGLYDAIYDISRWGIFVLRDSSSEDIFATILAEALPILGIGMLVMVYFAVCWNF
jgi:hypothetical protein